MSTPTPQEKPTAEQIDAAVASGAVIVCYAKCVACQFGSHFDPPKWHTWADDEDIEHAKNTGQEDPSTSRCGCPCAKEATR